MTDTRDPGECARRARDPETTPAELARLSRLEYIFVRELAACHEKTPTDALEAMLPCGLHGEEDFRIAGALLNNPALPARLTADLAALAPPALAKMLPREYLVQCFLESLAANRHAGPQELKTLIDPRTSPRHVRERIAAFSRRKDVLEILAKDPAKAPSRKAQRRLETIVT